MIIMTFKMQEQLRKAFAEILDKFGESVVHTPVTLTDATTGYYSNPTFSEAATVSYKAYFTEGIQKEMLEKYGEFMNGDCEFSFDHNITLNINDFIETNSRKYQVRQIHQRQDGGIVYQDVWCRIVKQ